MKFLIDECLHTSLVEVATLRGHESTHVNYRGLSGTPDWALMAMIRQEDFVFVTNNGKDFRRLYARGDVHAGLMVIVPFVPPAMQRVLFDAALEEMADGAIVNEAWEVQLKDAAVEITRYDWPTPEA